MNITAWIPGYTVTTERMELVTIWVLKFPGTDYTVSRMEYLPDQQEWHISHLNGISHQWISKGISDHEEVKQLAIEHLQEVIIGLNCAFVVNRIKPIGGFEYGK